MLLFFCYWCESVKPMYHCNVKTLALGPWVGLDPQREILRWEYQYVVSKNAKICVSPNANVYICVTPNATPNTSQWNIDCVGSPGIGACVGHVHFMLFMSISFALGSQLERSFRWNMGFKVTQQAVIQSQAVIWSIIFKLS